MSDLHQILQDYLSVRRSLGFKLEREGSLLPAFVTFLDKSGSPVITSALALAWAKQPAAATTYWWAARLRMVRTLARYAHTVDPRTEIPPEYTLPRTRPRPQPYIYSDTEVAALLAATHEIGDPFRAHTRQGPTNGTPNQARPDHRLSTSHRTTQRLPPYLAPPDHQDGRDLRGQPTRGLRGNTNPAVQLRAPIRRGVRQHLSIHV